MALPRQSAQSLAIWLAQEQPQVFEALLRKSMGEPKPQLNGLTDWLSSIGTTIGSAVTSASKYLTSEDGIKTLSTIGSVYLQTQAQKDALKLQLAQAQAGNALYPIQSVGANYNTAVPIYTPTGQSLTPSLTNQLWPTQTTNWLPWLLGGGALLLVGLFAFRGK